MKRTIILASISVLCLLQTGWGQVPRTISYQGVLKDAGGVLLNESVNLTFSIYAVASEGTALWSEPHSATTVTDGVFSVILGSSNPLDLDFDAQYWLQITVNDVPLSTRTQLTSSPYSFHALQADTAQYALTVPTGGGEAWSLTGNSIVAGDFLGSTNDIGLDFKVNGYRALRLEPHTTSPNVIGGYSENIVNPDVMGATIGGGGRGGGYENQVTANYGTVGGGFNNAASATVGGGSSNEASSSWATVSGGQGNTASGSSATVGGGANNFASLDYATVGGGGTNAASGQYSAIGGGDHNTASSNNTTIGGGGYNTASGNSATVPGGNNNTASGQYSFAAGRRAKAKNDGAFVWADATDADLWSAVENQFLVRASGGTIIYSNAAATAGVSLAAGSGSWADLSDRNAKENFRDEDGEKVLLAIADMPVPSWNYKSQDTSIRHLGPMAQDFYAAFGLGEDEKRINTVDIDGINMLAIQALEKRTRELEDTLQRLDEQQREIAELQAAVASLAAQAKVAVRE